VENYCCHTRLGQMGFNIGGVQEVEAVGGEINFTL